MAGNDLKNQKTGWNDAGLTEENTVVLACSSLLDYVNAAQEKLGTDYPVIVLDRKNHIDPELMKEKVREVMNDLPGRVTTVLVAMAFCGGVWDHVSFPRRVVIPRADDCVSILLHRTDADEPNMKETGHLYLYEKDPKDFSALVMFYDDSVKSKEYDGMDPEFLHHMWFDNYHYMDIIDTGLNDCYTEEYAAAAQNEADQINAALDYVPGSNLMMEKLLSGRWDSQFVVAQPGHLIRHADFF